jgi:hypothetical protein
VLRKLDGAAKELVFAARARDVDEVLDAQRDQSLPGSEESGRREEQREE